MCAHEGLQKTPSESIQDWLIGASDDEIIDVRTE